MLSIACFSPRGRHSLKFDRVAVLVSVAHALAWAAFLWIALWPYSYQGVSATPVQVDEQGNRVGTEESEVVRHSSSFVEENGIWALLPLFIPVALTGVALMALLTWKGGNIGIVSILWAMTVGLLAFCLLGYLSFGVIYIPSALALVIAASILSSRLRLPRVPQE